MRAAQHHKHILVEKPMALTMGEMDQIAAAVEKKRVMAMEALMYKLHPQTQRVCRDRSSGTLGAVQLVSAAFTYHVPDPADFRLSRALGGGCLLDVGTYCVSVARMANARRTGEVIGAPRFRSRSDVDEVFAGMLRFGEGRLATFGCALHGPREHVQDLWIGSHVNRAHSLCAGHRRPRRDHPPGLAAAAKRPRSGSVFPGSDHTSS